MMQVQWAESKWRSILLVPLDGGASDTVPSTGEKMVISWLASYYQCILLLW